MRKKDTRVPPFGQTDLDAGQQEALAELVIGLRFAESGARRLTRLLKDHVCPEFTEEEKDFRICPLCFLQDYARHTPFVVSLLRSVDNELTRSETEGISEVHAKMRAVLNSLVKPADEPIRVEGRAV